MTNAPSDLTQVRAYLLRVTRGTRRCKACRNASATKRYRARRALESEAA